MTNAEYRRWLIGEILKMQTKNQFVKADLENKPIRALEIIFDHVE